MAKFAFSSLPCDGWSALQIAEVCRKYGFTGVELREGEGMGISLASGKEQWLRDSEIYRENGIEVTNIGTGICVKGDAKDWEQLTLLKKQSEMAQVMGAKGLRVFLGNFARRRDAALEPLDHKVIIKWLQDASAIAGEYGIGVWIETHNEYATGRVLRELLDKVNRTNCAVIYDIIHPLEDGESPEDTIRLLGDACVHVHMKDGVPMDDPLEHDWLYTKVGEGAIPIGDIVRLLEQGGYKGYYSLEWETKWRQELQQPGMDVEQVFPEYINYMNESLQKLKK
jgi:sugar phosphate isomerase/epimerase